LENKPLNIARALWWEEDVLYLLDQTRLPTEELVLEIRNQAELVNAIQALSIRGAPALGIAGAYGILLTASDWKQSSEPPDWPALRKELEPLMNARPTAVNLRWAIERVLRQALDAAPATRHDAYRLLVQAARDLHEEDEERCRRIGEHGAALLKDSGRIITHCNTGALATGGIGTALGVIYAAVMQGKAVQVYADETRPLLQGARLTAWELQRAHIPVTVLTDGMAAALMQQESIDCVIVGADRIAANGDTANKIGTYQLAVAARFHDVSFYVAAPTSTIDLDLDSGRQIPIEMRSGEEVLSLQGVRTAPEDVDAYAPAFDVTPARLISAIITDLGVLFPPYNLKESLGKRREL